MPDRKSTKKQNKSSGIQAAILPYFPPWVLFGIVIWAAVVATFYYQTNWPDLSNLSSMAGTLDIPTGPAFLAIVKTVGLVVWLGLLCILLGRRLLIALKVPFTYRLDFIVFSGGIGTGVLILILFALGLAGLWRTSHLWGINLGLTGLLLFFNKGLFVKSSIEASNKRSSAPTHGLTDTALVTLIVLFLACYLLETLAPEIFYDSMVYHLAIPHQWLLAHRIVATPHNLYSGIPFNMEVLYGVGLAFAGPVLAKLLHFATGVGCLATLFAMARRYANARAGWVACLVFVSSPMVALEFGKTAVELGTAFFGLLSVYALLLSQAETDAIGKNRWLLVSGLLCGFCMGTKYTSFVIYPALVMMHIMHRIKDPSFSAKTIIRELIVLTLPAIVIISPWLVKNLVFYKNPLYPFLQTLFPNAAAMSDVKSLVSDAHGRDMHAQFSSLKGIWDFVVEPWTVTMTGRSDSDFIGPAYLAMLPLALLSLSAISRRLLWAFGVQWYLYSLSSSLVRFRTPALAILAVLVAIGWANEHYPKWIRRGMLAGVALFSFTNFTWANLIQYSMEGWKVTLGMVSASDYLNHSHSTYPTPYFSAGEFISTQTPEDAKVLILGDGRSLYIDRPFINATLFDTHPLFQWANDSVDGEALARKFQAEGITYIFLNAAEANRVRNYWKGAFTPAGAAVFDQFWQKHAHLVFHDAVPAEGRFTFVYAVVPDRAPLEPGASKTQNIFLEILAPH